ncbi:MAG: hypothetical protein FD138_4536 [Planctomycetota bacterium]|nr:MAG: hypothetical protein FD138_4536 [Planctomycetota bacterium]
MKALLLCRLSFFAQVRGIGGGQRQESQRGERVGRREDWPGFVDSLPGAVLALIMHNRGEHLLQSVLRRLGVAGFEAQCQQEGGFVEHNLLLLGSLGDESREVVLPDHP